MTTKVRKLKAVLGFNRTSDTDLLKILNAVHDGMNGNPAYPNPPVDMAVFKTAIDSLFVLVTDSADGGKKIISAKNKQRESVIRDVTLLGHYVEAVCNDDLATFTSSGFTLASTTRTPPQALTTATLDWIDRGPNSGQTVVKVTTQKGAVSYTLRYALVAGGVSAPWTEMILTSPKKVTIDNLTPGSTYAFQVRALGKLGYSDWSDSMTFICA
jgi:hypothetical protein